MKSVCLALAALALAAAGCVRREILITTEPTGASALLDQTPAGTTPCTIPFTFYGKRELVLEKDRFERKRAELDISPPFYQWFPLDFLSEHLLPVTLTDRHEFHFPLSPIDAENPHEVLKRAEEFRSRMPKQSTE